MESILSILESLLKLLVVLLVLGLGTERGTQLVKEFLRLFSGKIAWLNFSGRRSFLLAAAIAFFVSYFLKVDVTQYLQLLDGFDPELVKLVNALLVMFFSNTVHDKFFKSVSV